MNYFSPSQELLPASRTDNDFFRDMPLMVDYRRQTLAALLQRLDADDREVTDEDLYEDLYESESPVFRSPCIIRPKISKGNPIQTETELSSTRQEMTKTKGKEKEKSTLPDRSSMLPLLELLQGFASHERFDGFKPIHDYEMVEPLQSLAYTCSSSIYTGPNFLDSDSLCNTTSSNAIAGPSRVTLDDLERRERALGEYH